ncbi:hypothetical protein R2601_03683 [Salipiger bermudensis HTCC2601]|uniref:Uncharacterized protein n=1 Tax=Salipiger bermudensis (strain DSM 26914 / JCM 13377 / KCTC 12554 / HTCC2601) TaxID=314265 RepID=Q0FWA9_SALBH|nr:hypothetical protein R2601_03683 [Salipiger bermudensis HTCC2601]
MSRGATRRTGIAAWRAEESRT